MLHFYNSISIFHCPVAKLPVRRSEAEVEAIGPCCISATVFQFFTVL
jgi:hypothetical protein